MQNLTQEEARVLVRETVRETFLMLGLKVDDPIEVQKDFQHLRDWRETTDAIKTKGAVAATGIVVTGAVGALWLGVKEFLKGG